MRNRLYCFVLLLGLSSVVAQAAEGCCPDGGETMQEADTLSLQKTSTHKSHNPIRWISNYLGNTNKHENRKFDFSMLIGPSYSPSTSIGLGVTASGLYSLDRTDPELPKSNVSVFANASASGMFAVGVRGNNFLPHQRYRLDYQLMFFVFPGKFWGIGYDNGKNDDNESDYDRVKIQFKPDFLFRLGGSMYVGPVLDIEWINAYGFDNEELLEGQDKSMVHIGLGWNFTFDNRDNVLNAYKGHYFRWEQIFYPSEFGNDYAFNYTDLTYSTYNRVWKGGILAFELHTLFNYGDVPWTMMAQVGVLGRMRGYYEGRYRDRNIMEGQLELRLHVKGRSGVVVWVGLGNVFRNFGHISLDETLPNYGLGYRWEFKKRVNVRFDFGFTKDKPSFLFNINEAF